MRIGIIYGLVEEADPDTIIYIGSCWDMKKRYNKTQHLSWKPSRYPVILGKFPCQNISERFKIEQNFIEKYDAVLTMINKNNAFQDHEAKLAYNREQNRKWVEKDEKLNPTILTEKQVYNKEYYETHKTEDKTNQILDTKKCYSGNPAWFVL